MKLNGFIFILLFCTTACGQSDWLSKNTHELKPGNTYNFEALGKKIGNKKIIAIGESTHGLGEFYTLKSELVKYLHREHDYEILAFEAGLGDVNLAWMNIDSLSSQELMKQTIFQNFQCKEIEPLFEYLKSESNSDGPLIYAGFDTQRSSNYFVSQLKEVLKSYNPSVNTSQSGNTFTDTLDIGLSYYYKMAQAMRQDDSLGYIQCRNSFSETVREAKRILQKHEEVILEREKPTALQFQVMIRTLDSFLASVDLSYENRYDGSLLRDELMAANFKWLIEELYPNKKVIIWAHNAHLEKANRNPNYKWMGHFLKETYGEEYYALGLFANKGTAFRFWDRELVDFEQIDSTFISKKMTATKKNTSFLDLSNLSKNKSNAWLFEEVSAFEMENGGVVNFIPVERFDGIITLRESGSPTFKK
ncbi:MAG: erythromycin esterase family protein [Saprospiraceae bacterium]